MRKSSFLSLSCWIQGRPGRTREDVPQPHGLYRTTFRANSTDSPLVRQGELSTRRGASLRRSSPRNEDSQEESPPQNRREAGTPLLDAGPLLLPIFQSGSIDFNAARLSAQTTRRNRVLRPHSSGTIAAKDCSIPSPRSHHELANSFKRPEPFTECDRRKRTDDRFARKTHPENEN